MEWKNETLRELYEKIKKHFNVETPESETSGGLLFVGGEWLSLSVIVGLMKDLDD